jgi:hypothetical protein
MSVFKLAANEKGFVQVGDFEFRLLVNVSQIFILSSKLVVCPIAFGQARTEAK